MALPSAEDSAAGTPEIESYRPAPDMPARSSTFADDRTMSVASFSNAFPAQIGKPFVEYLNERGKAQFRRQPESCRQSQERTDFELTAFPFQTTGTPSFVMTSALHPTAL